MHHFRYSFLISLAGLGLAAWWGQSIAGTSGAIKAVGMAAILCIMEISLSFDNAIVNASILKNWSQFWQNLFLTLGMFIAVFGMRLLFPLLIVAFAADIGLLEVWKMGLERPAEYAQHLTEHHAEVAVFGGMFLLLVFLNFILDEDKELHWLGFIEKKIASFGKITSIALMIAISVLLSSIALVGESRQLAVLISGLWGILTYVAVDVVSSILEVEEDDPKVGDMIKRGGVGGFLYLEMLDASFSFDGVIGALAITKDIVIIMIGLAIGAMFVRSMTVYLVRQGTLDKFVFLEHGAHYAIGILAIIMLVSMKFHIPEVFTGLVGVGFILASLWSSIFYKQKQ
ncbi:MAG: DUF475 domain-containing protein [Gallionellaceae bacterium]